MLNRLFLLVLVHLSPGLRHECSDEERHGAAHPAEVEEEAAGAEEAEQEAGGLHRHEDHQEVEGDGRGLNHRLQVWAEPLGYAEESCKAPRVLSSLSGLTHEYPGEAHDGDPGTEHEEHDEDGQHPAHQGVVNTVPCSATPSHGSTWCDW